MFHDCQLRQTLVRGQEAHPGTDILVILVSALKVFHVGSKVGIDNAEAGIVEDKPHGHTPLVTLQGRSKDGC